MGTGLPFLGGLMLWCQVVIKNDENAPELTNKLIASFWLKHQELGYPQDATVWLAFDDGRDRIFYFSPKAVDIGIVGDIFRGFHLSVCSVKPDVIGLSKVSY
jgi:hypothetical protein